MGQKFPEVFGVKGCLSLCAKEAMITGSSMEGAAGGLTRLHFDACAGCTRGIHSMVIQVVHCMVCVIACILYVDKNDKLKPHYRQEGLILMTFCL